MIFDSFFHVYLYWLVNINFGPLVVKNSKERIPTDFFSAALLASEHTFQKLLLVSSYITFRNQRGLH